MEQIILSGLSVTELIDRIELRIDECMKRLSKAEEIKEVKLISRQETADLLKITLPTLRTWTKFGLVKGYKIGHRVLYKLDEVMESVTEFSVSGCSR